MSNEQPTATGMVNISIGLEYANRLKRIAKKNKCTVTAQVRHWIDREEQRSNAQNK